MSQRTELQVLLEAAYVDLARAKALHPATWSGLVSDQPGWPKAAVADPDRGARTASDHWCDTHGRDLAVCATAKLHCAPTPGPLLSDPTGEAAIQPSKAREDARKYVKAVQRAVNALSELRRIQDTYSVQPALPPGGLVQSEPGCDSCARVGKWMPVHRYSTVAGRLPDKKRLCKWCRDWVQTHSQLPPRATLTDHHAGKRITTRETP